MEAHEHHEGGASVASRSALWRSPATWIFVGFGLVGAFYLLTAHPAHVWGYLPYVLLLACPFLHLLMHRKGGGHGGD